MASRKLRDVDQGYQALVRRFYALEDTPVIDVGVLEAEGAKVHEGGPEGDGTRPVTVLDVATWNEFGTGQIPERSFIRAWFDEQLNASARRRRLARKR